LLIITTTQRFYRILLVANGSGQRLKLAKLLPDIFLGQRATKKTDFRGVQGLARIQRGQLSYQLARTISALTVAIFALT
jgi:hypothetical protein